MRSPLLVLAVGLFAPSLFVAGGTASAAPAGHTTPHAATPAASTPPPVGGAPTAGVRRWTAETPDAMVAFAKARALTAHAPEADVVASIATLLELGDRAKFGAVGDALSQIAASDAVSKELRGEAALAAASLAPDDLDKRAAGARSLGVLSNLAILGPFRDTGGGLTAKDGPEAKGASFADTQARYSWGAFEVAWRKVPASYAGADGVPLDLFIHPRKESCSIVATRVTFDGKPVVVRAASTGSVRLMIDGVELGKSDDVHAAMVFDRVAARVEAPAGPHLVWAKVCTGALDDDGRVRLRLTDEAGAPVELASSADLVDAKGPAPRAARRETPLARALAARGDLDRQLDAIVVRTLGGADDLKSPRAPGLLDTLTHAAGIDADRLAMAGWVAPSGANRSGWLSQARARAESTGDSATKSFCDRRLIAAHLGARMADWAIAALRGTKGLAPSDNAKDDDSEAVLLRAMTLDALGTDALRAAAAHDLWTAFEASPKTAPTSLLQELDHLVASDAARLYPVRTELARRRVDIAGLPDGVAPRGAKAVTAAARAAFAGGLGDVDEGLSAARAVTRAGDHEAARGLYTELITFAPNRAEVWAGLADAVAATSSVRAKPEQAKQEQAAIAMALRRARELAPGEARYRAELALRTPHATPEGREDEKYLAPSEKLLAHRQGVPAPGTPPEAADRELYWLRAVVMHPDRRVSQLLHYAREIVIAPRTEDELVEDLPAEGDLTEILRARVHRKDGGTAFPVEEHNEGTRPRIRWPELLPGDTVEVAVRTWTANPVGGRGDPPFYFMDYAGAPSTHPLLYNEVIVDTPKSFPLYLDVLHADGPTDSKIQGDKKAWAGVRTDKDEGERHIARYVWEHPVTVPEEPLSPSLTEIVPVIVGSTFHTWTDFRAWYQEAVRGFTSPDDQVKRLAAELTKGKTTRDQKLKALFDFVADDIRYVNYVSGEWWLPNRPQQLLARREGDCDDKAILLITLLRAVGIEAQEVMVQTRETGQPSVLLAKNAAVPLFDHGIAFLPGPNGGTYLDATSPQSRLGPLPSMDARARALRMDAGTAEIVELPKSSPEDHGSSVSWTIALHPDGSGDLTGEETHVGDGAFWLRTYLTQPDARAQYVEENLVGGWFPTVEVDKKIDFVPEQKNGAATVKYKAHSDGLARHEQKDLVVPLSPSATLASQLAPLVNRTLPTSLPSYLAPSHQERTIRIVAPPGFAWGDLPPGGDVSQGELGRAHLEVGRDPKDPRAVLIKRSVVLDQHVIPVEKYAAWRTFLLQVDALMHKGVRLVPAGGDK